MSTRPTFSPMTWARGGSCQMSTNPPSASAPPPPPTSTPSIFILLFWMLFDFPDRFIFSRLLFNNKFLGAHIDVFLNANSNNNNINFIHFSIFSPFFKIYFLVFKLCIFLRITWKILQLLQLSLVLVSFRSLFRLALTNDGCTNSVLLIWGCSIGPSWIPPHWLRPSAFVNTDWTFHTVVNNPPTCSAKHQK